MVSLLGPRDELLRTIERLFPLTVIHVRGNEFHISGPSGEVSLVERLIDELLAVIDGGQALNRDSVERSIGMKVAPFVLPLAVETGTPVADAVAPIPYCNSSNTRCRPTSA